MQNDPAMPERGQTDDLLIPNVPGSSATEAAQVGTDGQVAVPPGSEPALHSTAIAASCRYYSGDSDPQYVMRDGFIDWDAYWTLANTYVTQRTAQYTPEEQLLAKAIWSEQKTSAATTEAQVARRQAMIAVGYIILHRRDQRDRWFGSTNTITEVLEDTRQDIQFQGYWRWRTLDVTEDYLLHKEQNGVLRQQGIGWESPDRAIWFEALDIARGVLQSCEPNIMPNSLHFGHGPYVQQLIQQQAQQDSTFEYQHIAGPDLWISNKPFR